jgi:uncharacterized protein YbjT (DUF2867 family)
MNVLIIGVSGRTGGLTAVRAVAAGHRVTALVRNAANYHPPAGVRVLAGSPTDPAALGAAMAGQEAVIDTIGGKTPFLTTDTETTVAKALLAAMKQHGTLRLIAVSALGVGDSQPQGTFFFRHLILPLFLRGSTRDKAQMEEAIRASGVEFVLVRPAVLTDQEAQGSARVFAAGETADKITRADVAQFLVGQLESDVYLGQAVTIAND